MKSILVRYVLSLCILLLSGYGQLHAHASRTSIHSSSSGTVERSEQVSFEAPKNNLPSIRQLSAPDRPRISIIDAQEVREEDEHDLIPAKKKRQFGTDEFAAVFCALTRGYFLSCIQEILPFFNFFSDTPSFRRHLILQVFRI